MKHIACFQLLSDYSGSPKVLTQILRELLKRDYQVDLISSKGGVLDELNIYPNLKRYSYQYTFSNNVLVTMLRYISVQIYTFFFAFRYLSVENCVFYINTLLPIGPALAGRIMGKHVIYHYHENAFAKGSFYKILAWAMQYLAHEIICVSAYQASFLTRQNGVVVIPNTLPQDFTNKLGPNPQKVFKHKNILMLSSLKEYKGTNEFIELAKRLHQFKFTLVINDTQENIDKYLKQITPFLDNLTIYPRQTEVYRFYSEASVVINLTNPKLAIETFGLTALEAMAAGLPIIVPTVGGISELVSDGVNGYKIDAQELSKICECIKTILTDEQTYLHLATGALEFSKRFNEKEMVDCIVNILGE